MDRDKLIVDCVGVVENLVKKYNNHIVDEDLVSCGMIAVVECVNRCIEDKMTDENQIKARCNTWSKNRILNEIYKAKLKYVEEPDDVINSTSAPEDLRLLIDDVRKGLTPKQLEVFELLLRGYNKEYIKEKLGIKDWMYSNHVKAIKEKIQN